MLAWLEQQLADAHLGRLSESCLARCALSCSLFAVYTRDIAGAVHALGLLPLCCMLCKYVHGSMQKSLQHLWHTSNCAPATSSFVWQLVVGHACYIIYQ